MGTAFVPRASSFPPDKGRLVTPRRASGGETRLSQGRRTGQKETRGAHPSHPLPRLAGALPGCGLAAEAIRSHPGARTCGCSRPAERERGAQSGGWRARAGLPGPSIRGSRARGSSGRRSTRLPSGCSLFHATVMQRLSFHPRHRKFRGYRDRKASLRSTVACLSPADPPYLQKEG